MVTRLPRNDGFSQRHVANPGVTKYLKSLDSDGTNFWRSPVSVSLIRNDIFQYHNGWNDDLPDSLRIAVQLADRAFRLKEPVKMLHLNDVLSYDLPIWRRSPGLPWKSLGYQTKDDVRHDPKCRQSIRWFWHRIKYGDKIGAPDCCAFVRSHLAELGDTKVRAVWGYPMTMTIGEAVFAIPLIEAYQQQSSPIAYGYETAVGGTYRLKNEMGNCKSFSAIDFSSFDKTVPVKLIKVAFDILLRNIDLINYREHGVADARRMLSMWDYIIEYFLNTPIRLCNGERFKKHSGVASGSYFTQLIDSIVNYILIVWVYIEQTGLPPRSIKVLGDDSVAGSDKKLDLCDANDLFRSIGMSINLTKSAVSKYLADLTFLGYQINFGIPTKPHSRWMAALLYPERPDRCWDDVASRAVGLCYAAFGLDDRFDTLCRIIITLQPFDLCIDSSLARMLHMIGWEHVSKDPPDRITFLRKLRLV
jgi:hypothetical protein